MNRYRKLNPFMYSKAMQVRKHVYEKVFSFDVTANISKEPLPFEDRAKGKMIKIIPNLNNWGRAYSCAWFHITGTIPTEYRDKKLGIIFNNGGEGLLVDDKGNPVSSNSSNHDDAFKFCAAGGKYYMDMPKCENGVADFWIDGGFNTMIGFGMLHKADCVCVRESVYKYYYDFVGVMTAYFTFLKKDKENAEIYEKALNDSFKVAGKFTDEEVIKADDILLKLLNVPSNEDFTLYAVGHSHLDLAWLWPIRETKRKSIRTIVNALNMIERFPDYVYGISQPQQLEWLETTSPELYRRLAEKVASGNIELQGGMWVESDTNLISGESLIRQIMFGKRYYKEHFGKDIRTCWEPDVFGYSAVLPQIMKKTGLDYFMTQKLSWNEHNEFPYSTFVWEGLDDSQVIVHMPPEDTYNSNANAFSNNFARENFKEKNIFNKALMLFGQGDGGGGAGEAHIEMLKRTENLYKQPKVKMAPAIEFFDAIAPDEAKMTRYKGELYLEKHQGTYTSQANNKKYNRKIEYLLRDVEYFGAIAVTQGKNYPKEQMDKIWKEVLLYQFHDIIPGSSINRVYKESVPRYIEMIEELKQIRANLIQSISTNKEKALFNTTSYEREELVEFDGRTVIATAKPFSNATITELDESVNADLVANDNVIENKYIKVVFGKCGNIVSLVDKITGFECAEQGGLNNLRVFIDKRLHYNAWDIDINYTNQTPQYFDLVSCKSYIKDGASVMRSVYKYHNSTLTQEAILEFNKPFVKFKTNVKWHERHKMLRAEFYPKTFADEVTCDIQFGNIKRTTKTDDKVSWAQFEICAHKYVDVSGDGYGYAIMCESKYGYRVKDGLMSLNLLRSPKYPDKHCDIGEHNFTYCFMPHIGDVFYSEVPKHALLLNIPFTETDCIIDNSQVSVNKRNIIIDTVKPSENGKGYVIRMYENEGIKTEAELITGLPYSTVNETDMLENIIGNININLLVFKPYEIKTLYFEI